MLEAPLPNGLLGARGRVGRGKEGGGKGGWEGVGGGISRKEEKFLPLGPSRGILSQITSAESLFFWLDFSRIEGNEKTFPSQIYSIFCRKIIRNKGCIIIIILMVYSPIRVRVYARLHKHSFCKIP